MLAINVEDTMRYIPILLGASLAALLGAGAAGADRGQSRSSALGELRFPFDSAALRPEVLAALDKVAAFAAANPDVKIVLDAHTDASGAADYNVKLAIRRAEAVRAKLKAKGVDDNQVVLAIYGESGSHHARDARDRRVTIWSTREPLANLIDHTFAERGTAVRWQRPLTVAQIEGRIPVASR